ncbi:MAG: ribosome silencing factor [Candidatus Cloacimonadales bacterium]
MNKQKIEVEKIIEWALEKKAENLKYYDIHETSDYTDFVIVCQGSGRLHVQAIAHNILDNCREHKMQIYSSEGIDNGKWVLLDLVDIIVHIFDEETRSYYKLEDLLETVPARN